MGKGAHGGHRGGHRGHHGFHGRGHGGGPFGPLGLLCEMICLCGLCATLFGSPPPPPPPPPPPAYGQAPVAQNPMYQAPPPYNG